MEPLDPKAELMRLADEWNLAEIDLAIDKGDESDAEIEEQVRLAKQTRIALSAAITQALADARRLALEEAANQCEIGASGTGDRYALACHTCASFVRSLINGKAGGT